MGALVPLAVVLAVYLVRSKGHKDGPDDAASIAKVGNVATPQTPPRPLLGGLDLTKITVNGGVASAQLEGKRTARLTIEPPLQRVAHEIMAMHHLPEAAVVLMDTVTGRVLVYASHVEKGPARDLCAEATAPAASVFKVVTGSALVESAGIGPDHRECYSGGEQRILERDLTPDPKRDRWCTTLAGAMGRSINTVFARLALQHLKPAVLEETAKNLGFGSTLPFDVPVQPSALRFPEDSLGFARTAAGFWNTTLSPIHAAWLSATMARGGEPVRPHVVSDVMDDAGKVVWTAPQAVSQPRVIKAATARAVTTMMDETVSDGTSYKAFHDGKGKAFLADIPIAGKTGTLTDGATQRFYTWFTGFSRASEDDSDDVDGSGASSTTHPVAVGVLVVNNPTWTIKANVLAREVLRAYFAEHKAANVTMPQLRLTTSKKKTAAPAKRSGKSSE
ncbi:Cell division protein FtsI [Labilithrix luteola]|uniref:Cell division protein FtsI n=1 Tax=Labilithrix luteola TaxID=1391654 RepID=A0A0K1PV54_9BACT|nr:Cell division protein FtsI [Labilithrix luteola]